MGAITAAVIGAGTALYTTSQSKKQQNKAIAAQKEMVSSSDPFQQYRSGAASQLSALASGQTDLSTTASYKARLQAAERTLAAQGYTGSGNAAIAAADAGAAAYQQEFDNLSRLAGVDQGQGAAVGAYSAGNQAVGNANDNYLSGLAGVGNNLANVASMWGNRTSGAPTYTGSGSAIGGTSGSFLPTAGSAGSAFFTGGG